MALKIGGVVSVIKAATIDEVYEEIKQDPYYKNGVWDPKTVSAERSTRKELVMTRANRSGSFR